MTRHSIDDLRNEEKEKSYGRLPKCVVPIHYDLTFEPVENSILDGRMCVRVQVLCETKEIILNGLNIDVTKAVFTPESNEEGKLMSKCNDVQTENEIIRVEFPTFLAPGVGLLEMAFEAKISENMMKGVFYSQTAGVDGQKTNNIVTHFEPVNARRCFPSFDEPEFKATFEITLIVKKGLVALSNMPLKEEQVHEKDENLRICKFETTPKMSTYLIAFVIGEFDHLEKKDANGVLVRVFTPLGKQKQGEFALELATKALPYYNQYFGIKYPLPKCDLVASLDFDSGAMENYGLVIFRDIRLLVDPLETSALSKQYTSLVISHEIAHFWFGNLVTMKWWTDLWLKEGFANFIENLCTHNFFPEFDCWTQFVTNNTLCAMITDSLQNSHPIEVPVTNPSEIDEIFDNITYNKGSSIIRMMYNFIGDTAFRRGMNKYLTKFQYSNAETEDLWDALEEASGRPVKNMMDTFTKQMGFPLVTVLSVKSEGDRRIFKLKQEKFWADSKFYSEENKEMNKKYRWLIPVTFCKGTEPEKVCHEMLFDGKASDEVEVVVEGVGPDEWVKINAGVVGYYRVRYPPEVLCQFTQAIETKTMSAADRAGLLNDLHANVKCGQSSTVDILSLLKFFTNETSFIVWSAIRDILMDIHNLILRTDFEDKFREYGISVFKPLKNRIGWDSKPDEGHMDALIRSLVMNRLISFGCGDTIAEAKKLFEHHIAGEKMISADLRVSVYKSFLNSGKDEDLQLMLNIFRESEMSEEKVRILHALGAIKDKGLLQKILNFSISEDVKPSMLNSILFSLTCSKEGQDLIWKFFKDNINLFRERYPGGFQIVCAVELVTENFASDEMALEIETFLKENPCRGTERTVQQVVENIRINSNWLRRDLQSINQFLKDPAGVN